MGRINKKAKIVIISILFIVITVVLFSNNWIVKAAAEVVRSVEDHTGNYPLPRYITYEQYINDPYLLCTGKGISIPSYNQTMVRTTTESGEEVSTHTTDQGKDTGYLTVDDLGIATCFSDDGYKGLADTTSKTYGYYTEAIHHNATPAETYILAELDQNKPGNGVDFETTDRLYSDQDAVNEEAYIEVDGEKYYIVEYNSAYEATAYVVKVGNEYYEVELNETEGEGSNSAVQIAWWAIGTAQEGARVAKNSLAQEAEAFEKYIEQLSPNGEIKIIKAGETEVADVTEVKLNKNTVEIKEGNTEQLIITMEPTNVEAKDITWTTSNKDIVKVDKNGELTAIKAGTATITVALKEDSSKSATCTVTVVPKDSTGNQTQTRGPVTGIVVDRDRLVLEKGQTGSYTVKVLPTNANNLKFDSNSENRNVAIVKGGDGLSEIQVEAVGVGETTITVTARGDTSKTATIKVIVKESLTEEDKNISVHRVELDKEKISIKQGETGQISATVFPNDATNKNLTFSSSNTDIATVDDTGKITAVKAGNVDITVTTEDGSKTATCKVTVTEEDVVEGENPETVDGKYVGLVTQNNLFDITYETSMESENAEVLRDETTNKYRIGPFKVNYLRSVFDSETRVPADFSGITDSILVGKYYIDGEEVLKEIPTDKYKFVYEHDHEAERAKHNTVDSPDASCDPNKNIYYPYPYSGEEFYIELDYLEDLAALTSFKFNFHYMNGGGVYTVFHGTYLTIYWKAYESGVSASTGSGSATLETTDSEITLLNNMVKNVEIDEVAEYNTTIDVKDVLMDNAEAWDDTGETVSLTRTNQGLGYNNDIKITESGDNHIITFTMPSRYWFTYGLGYVKVDGGSAKFTNNAPTGATIKVDISGWNTTKVTITIPTDKTKLYNKGTFSISVSLYKKTGHRGAKTTYTMTANVSYSYKNSLEEYLNKIAPKIETTSSNTNISLNSSKKIEVLREGFLEDTQLVLKQGVTLSDDWDIYIEDPDTTKAVKSGDDRLKLSRSGTAKVRLEIKSNGKTLKTYFYVFVPAFSMKEAELTLAPGESKSTLFYNANGSDTGKIADGEALEKEYKLKEIVSVNNSDIVLDEDNLGSSSADPYISTIEIVDGKMIKITAGSVLPVIATIDVTINDVDPEGVDTVKVIYEGNAVTANEATNGNTNTSGPDEVENSGVIAQTATEHTSQPQATPGGPDIAGDPTQDPTEVGTGAAYLIDYEDDIEFLPDDFEIDLTTSIAGMVWEDIELINKGEDIRANGVYNADEGDIKLPKVEVRIWEVIYEKNDTQYTEIERYFATVYRKKTVGTNGSIKLEELIDFESDNVEDRLFTDDNGDYVAYMNVPAVEGLDPATHKVSYDVEFIYDGQTYEVTEYLASTGKTDTAEKVETFKATSGITTGSSDTPNAVDYSMYANDSYAIETYDERKEFDGSFSEIYGQDPIDDSGNTTGEASKTTPNGSEDDKKTLNYTSGDQGFNEEQTSDGEADQNTSNNAETRKVSTLVTKQDGYVKDEFKMKARTSTAGLLLPHEDRIHLESKKEDIPLEYIDTGSEGAYTYYKPIEEYFSHINLGLVNRNEVDLSVSQDLYKALVTVNQDELTYKYNVLTDLEHENYADKLNMLLDIQNAGVEYSIGLYESDFYYRSNVYKANGETDIKKKIFEEKAKSELRVFASYRIGVYNDSRDHDVNVNELTEYFDSTYTLIDKSVNTQIEDENGIREGQIIAEPSYYRIYSPLGSDLSKPSYYYNSSEDRAVELSRVNRSENDSENMVSGEVTWTEDQNFSETIGGDDQLSGYKKMTTNTFTARNEDGTTHTTNELTLRPGEKLEVFVTFEVDYEGYDAAGNDAYNDTQEIKDETRKNLLGNKNTIVEISNYTSFYTEESLKKNNNVAYKAGEVSGRVDKDSAADNVNFDKTETVTINDKEYTVLDKSWFEDDTESAPIFRIYLREGDNSEREINGIVWEDKLSKAEESNGYTGVGNGKYDEGETVIPGATVTLVEKIKIKDEEKEQIKEYEYVWPDDAFGDAISDYTSVTMSNGNGVYTFKDFVSGNYVVRFEYGNTAMTLDYNGQDYKNTSYQEDIQNPTADELTEKYTDEGTGELHTEKMNNDQMNGALESQITLNNEWHDLTGLTKGLTNSVDENGNPNDERISDARDYEARRLDVIEYSRTIDNAIAEVLATADSPLVDKLKEALKAKMYDSAGKQVETYKTALEIVKGENTELANFVGSPEYKALIAFTAMEANTSKLNIQIESSNEIDFGTTKKSVDGTFVAVNGGSYEQIKEAIKNTASGEKYTVNNIDFGIERRADTILQTDKYLTKVELLKENERIFFIEMNEDGSYNKDTVVAPEKILYETESNGVQGFKYINIEEDYLKDTTLNIFYNIRVTNKSELDYASETLVTKTYTTDAINKHIETLYGEYETGENIKYGKYIGLYYYTHDTGAVKENKTVAGQEYNDAVVTTTVDQVVDYIDTNIGLSEACWNGEANNTWTNILNYDGYNYNNRLTTLEGLISEKSYTEDEENEKYYLQDDKGNLYISETRNNIAISNNDNIANNKVTKQEAVLDRGEKGEGQLTYLLEPGQTPTDEGYKKFEKFDGKVIYATTENVYVYKDDEYEVDKVNSELTKELTSINYQDEDNDNDSTGTIAIQTRQDVSSTVDIENMLYDNVAEVLIYSNPVGRRTMSAIPGNAIEIIKNYTISNNTKLGGGAWNAGHSSNEHKDENIVKDLDTSDSLIMYIPKYQAGMVYALNTKEVLKNNTEEDVHIAELDADATDFVTFTEPTGLSYARQQQNLFIGIMLATLIILAIGIILVTIKVVMTKSTDDITIESTKE